MIEVIFSVDEHANIYIITKDCDDELDAFCAIRF